MGLPSSFFPSGFPTKPQYTPLLSSIRVTCPVHQIFLDLITWIILAEEYGWLSSSLCSFLHSPVTSSFLGPNILPTPYSQISCPFFRYLGHTKVPIQVWGILCEYILTRYVLR
jgi:hypothetical protein